MTSTTLTSAKDGNWQTYNVGDYSVKDGNFGAYSSGYYAANESDITIGPQNGNGLSNVVIANNFPNYTAPVGWVWGYSEVYWGSQYYGTNQNTTPVSNITSLVLNYSTTLAATVPVIYSASSPVLPSSAHNPNESGYSVLINMSAINKAGLITNDIAIYVGGAQNWAYGQPTGAFTGGGITAQVYISPENQTNSAPAPYTAADCTHDQFFVNASMLSGSIDLAAVLQYLEKQGLLDPSETISGVELGAETAAGSTTLTVNSFNVMETVASAQTITNTGSANNQVFTVTTNNNYVINGGTYTGDSVAINSSALNFAITEKAGGEVDLSGSGYGSISISNVGAIQFADGSITDTNGKLSLSISSASLTHGGIDSLQKLIASGTIQAVALTDSGVPTISVSASQFTADTSALKAIGGTFDIDVAAGSTSGTITGFSSSAPNTLATTIVTFNGTESQYTISASTNGGGFTVTGNGITDHLAQVQQVIFSDTTMTLSKVGSMNEYAALLYQAALGRTPDAAGVNYWTQIANALPSSTAALGVYALADTSGGYAGNLSIAGGFTQSSEFQAKYGTLTDTQFVTNLYANVLDRTPATSEIAYWVDELEGIGGPAQSREHVLIGFAESNEAITNATKGFTGQTGYHAPWLILG